MSYNYELTNNVKKLLDIFSLLKTPNEIENFVVDLFTPQELEEFALRWKLAVELEKGKNQRQIAREVNCSVTTVSRASKVKQFCTGSFNKIFKANPYLYNNKS